MFRFFFKIPNVLLITFCILHYGCANMKNLRETDNDEINILFVGNSLTYTNKMPSLLQQMLDETKKNISVYQRTAPGVSLKFHLKNQIPTVAVSNNKPLNELKLEKVLSMSWDYVILQEGTVRLLIPEVRKYNVEQKILEIKKQINPSCKIILFGTWVSKSPYPKQYCYPKNSIDNKNLNEKKYCTPEYFTSYEHIKDIGENYQKTGNNTETIYSNNGELFYSFSKKYPEINLLEDDTHPSKAGAFFNACIFYKFLTNKSPNKLKFSGDISEDLSKKIKKYLSSVQ